MFSYVFTDWFYFKCLSLHCSQTAYPTYTSILHFTSFFWAPSRNRKCLKAILTTIKHNHKLGRQWGRLKKGEEGTYPYPPFYRGTPFSRKAFKNIEIGICNEIKKSNLIICNKCWLKTEYNFLGTKSGSYLVSSPIFIVPPKESKWAVLCSGSIQYFCANDSALFWLNIRKRDAGIPFLKSARLDHSQHSSANIMAAHSHPVQQGDAGITNHLPFRVVQEWSH